MLGGPGSGSELGIGPGSSGSYGVSSVGTSVATNLFGTTLDAGKDVMDKERADLNAAKKKSFEEAATLRTDQQKILNDAANLKAAQDNLRAQQDTLRQQTLAAQAESEAKEKAYEAEFGVCSDAGGCVEHFEDLRGPADADLESL